jgi:hypothetical protein
MMPKRVPIASLRRFANVLGLSQAILVAWDGERMHVVTVGKSVEDSVQAAQGGNKVKRALGFPEDLCNSVPARARRRKQGAADGS